MIPESVRGECDAGFGPVADDLAAGRDVGTSVGVYLDGRQVVDLWGGWEQRPGSGPGSGAANDRAATTVVAARPPALIRAVTGRSVGRFFADEVATPLGLDLYLGLPADRHEHRLAFGYLWAELSSPFGPLASASKR